MNARLAAVVRQIIDSGIPVELIASLAGGPPVALGALAARALPIVVEAVSKLADDGIATDAAQQQLAAALEAAVTAAKADARRSVDAARASWDLVYKDAADPDQG